MPKLITPERQFIYAAALLLTLALSSSARAQGAAPATVAGRVTDGERGAQGVAVLLISIEPAQRFRAAARAKTDAEGRYLLTNVAPGSYQVLPVAPAYVVADLAPSFPPGRRLIVNAGEEVKDVDFKLEPGGVITGRVTDGGGNPVVAEQVFVQPADDAAGQGPRLGIDQRDRMTDDRGVYRIFGLPAGRYYVGVGRAGDAGLITFGRRKLFRSTFYPDAAERAQARVVEVKQGFEAENIDITVGRALKTYRVSGRFVAADSGQPVAGVAVGYSAVDARGRRMGSYAGLAETDARGEFSTDGVAPGRYAVFATTTFQQQTPEFYSDPLFFEVAEADVSGLVVRLKRGATVSGVVQIEGVADRAAAAQMLSAVRVFPWIEGRQQSAAAGAPRPTQLNPDGTFRLTGVVPGKLHLNTTSEAVKNLSTARVELNGANVMGGFDVAEGAQVAGVRIVLTYGTATLVGQTTYVNGTVPAGARVVAFARMVGSTGAGVANSRSAEVDARGLFRIEGLPAGEYDVSVNVFGPGRTSRSAPVRVSVGEGEAKVSPVVDFQANPVVRPQE